MQNMAINIITSFVNMLNVNLCIILDIDWMIKCNASLPEAVFWF